ncbi:MAG: hypothetical protein C0415_06485 [Thermodesulfovibrio sp.]|nr:hypothetical protein [Thermodesulfovibrio sp.]
MPKKKHGNKLPPFVALTWEMLNSKAYKELNYASAKALSYFLGKFKGSYHDPQRYLSGFSFSYSEAKTYRFSSATFSKIIQELVAKGFIDPVDRGGLRSDGKSYNLFKLSERWKDYGKPDFKPLNWKCFLPRLSKPHGKGFQQKKHELSIRKIIREANYEQSIDADKSY